MIKAAFIAVSAIVPVLPAFALQAGLPAQSSPPEWTQEQAPFRHILNDGALPESPPMIAWAETGLRTRLAREKTP
jgi:hypothetical protein